MFGMATQRDLEVMDKFFSEFIQFVTNKSNSFDFNEKSSNSNVNSILNKWAVMASELDRRSKDDMKVMGEIVLTTDKVEQGIYKCRVNAKTGNPMIQTLANTINKMVDVTEKNMNELRSVLKSYTTNDFKPLIDIDPMLKEDLLK
ncbi:MAG: hypothetical protein U9R37_07340, partial [Campylobacterota bacterium]|nr:hypothetical protein [Campylobacterota bacterium]